MQRDPTTVEDLKDRSVRACRTISPQILHRVRSAILDRAIFFERVHFKHMLWNFMSGVEVHIIYNFYCFYMSKIQ